MPNCGDTQNSSMHTRCHLDFPKEVGDVLVIKGETAA